MKKFIITIIISLQSIYAIQCTNYGDFKEYDGHYYAISRDLLTFESAKAIAQNNDGYVAIPNSQAENDFIKSLIGGNKSTWLGIEDSDMNTNYNSTNTERFKDINNN